MLPHPDMVVVREDSLLPNVYTWIERPIYFDRVVFDDRPLNAALDIAASPLPKLVVFLSVTCFS